MKVGIGAAIRNSPFNTLPLSQLYSDYIEEAVLADELGFSHYWLSEHHFAEDSWSPSPIPVLGAIAARTRAIRLGTFVALLALSHPVKVAEDVAVLDILSSGRMDMAVGPKPQAVEMKGFGFDPKEAFGRTYEALTIIEKCWTGERFDHEGKHFRLEGVHMTTPPVQDGGVPIFTAAKGPQSMALSAKRGYGNAAALHSARWETYEDLVAESGRDPLSVPVISGPLPAYVAPTRAQAWDEAEDALHWWVEFYNRRGANMPLGPATSFRNDPDAGIYGIPFFVGTPDDVLGKLSIHKDARIDEMNFQLHHPGMPTDQVRAAMKLFAAECTPVIETWGAR